MRGTGCVGMLLAALALACGGCVDGFAVAQDRLGDADAAPVVQEGGTADGTRLGTLYEAGDALDAAAAIDALPTLCPERLFSGCKVLDEAGASEPSCCKDSDFFTDRCLPPAACGAPQSLPDFEGASCLRGWTPEADASLVFQLVCCTLADFVSGVCLPYGT